MPWLKNFALRYILWGVKDLRHKGHGSRSLGATATLREGRRQMEQSAGAEGGNQVSLDPKGGWVGQ